MKSPPILPLVMKSSYGNETRATLFLGIRLIAISILIFFGLYTKFVVTSEPVDFKYTLAPQVSRVVKDLERLEQIAFEHRGSRSVVNGHKASVNYVLEVLHSYNSTWTASTQEVPVNVQVDEVPPLFNVVYSSGSNRTFAPRLEVGTARGSGSASIHGAKVKVVGKCSFSTKLANFVALIDTTSPSSANCNYCDRMAVAIREGAQGIIFITRPGNQEGYPIGLPPSTGRCGRIARYRTLMHKIGAISLGDDAAFEFLGAFLADPKLRVDMNVISTFREYITLNVIADSVHGNADNVVLFGSHLDSVPAGPGVNDDGSGAMATLELARSFAESGIVPVQKLRLCFWAAEEIGLVGSRFYVDELAKNNPAELQKIRLSLDNDMLASSNFIRGVYDGASIKEESKFKNGSIAIQRLFQTFFQKLGGLPTWPGVFDGRSDYVAFMDHGIPSGGLFAGADEIKTEQMAKLFGGVIGVALDPCYHQNCDRVSQLNGPALLILEQNLAALSFALEAYGSAANLTKILDPSNFQ